MYQVLQYLELRHYVHTRHKDKIAHELVSLRTDNGYFLAAQRIGIDSCVLVYAWRVISIDRQCYCILPFLVGTVAELYKAVAFLRCVTVCVTVRFAKVYIIFTNTDAQPPIVTVGNILVDTRLDVELLETYLVVLLERVLYRCFSVIHQKIATPKAFVPLDLAAFHPGSGEHIITACIRQLLYLQFGEHGFYAYEKLVHFNIRTPGLRIDLNHKAGTKRSGCKSLRYDT